MSFTVRVSALVPANRDHTNRMLDARTACEQAGVPVPAEVVAFFNDADNEDGTEPLASGDGGCEWYGRHPCAESHGTGVRINIAGLPFGTTEIVIEADA